ncbi:MAG: glycosyltransferase, partial [Pseudomonadota bacterium]
MESEIAELEIGAKKWELEEVNEKILIAAGGTGGHIYPALAIAEAIKGKYSGVQIEFVGTTTGVENDIVPKFGYPLHQLSIGRLHKSVGWPERIKTALMLPSAIIKAFSICFKSKPRFLLGVGGHASGPMLLAGALLRYPTYIWEPNAMPGLANRILSGYVDEAIVVFSQADRHLKTTNITQLGFPVRKAIETVGELGHAPKESGKINVLIYMGSQGAQSMNRLLPELLKECPEITAEAQFLHQTGKKNYEQALENYKELGVEGMAEVVPYIDDMQNKYVWADIVVCRSG